MSARRDKPLTHVTEILGHATGVTRLLPASAILFVPRGPDKGRTGRVGAEGCVVGTDPDCDLVLSDRTVSRRHAEVRRDGDLLLVRDLGSTNGTFYGEARVREVLVPMGGEVAFGKTTIRVMPEEVPVESAPFEADRLGPLVGGDEKMRAIFGLIRDIAQSDATVVIEGETGTGKELVAQAIHDQSTRARQPLVVFDCTSQPRDLVESALFGHVKGAFTGATGPRQGAFPRAHGGTLFLDELGELDLELQPKLLRVLEAREIQPVGGEGYASVDVRVVAATHRDLKSQVRAGAFRQDLYYRLAVIRIQLPALRERPGDVPRLVEHFIRETQADFTPSTSSLEALTRYPWPGNVRELRNLVDRAAALSRGRRDVDLTRFLQEDFEITDDLVAPPPAAEPPMDEELTSLSFKEAKGKLVAEFEAKYVSELLRTHANNISMAAREAGVDRKHFKELMRKHGITARGGSGDD